MDELLADTLPNDLETKYQDDGPSDFPVLQSCTRESDFISITSTWWNSPTGTADYDTKILILEASRNVDEPDAIENSFFDESMYENRSLLAMANVVKDDDVRFPVTRLLCKTVQGKFQVVQVTDGCVAETPQVPASLARLPKADLLKLRKVGSLSPAVDLVGWKDSLYAYKQVEDDNYAGILREIGILDKSSHSPVIINLSAIVVRDDDRLYGFLMPYVQRGSLRQAFETLQAIREGDLTVPWTIKLSWAQQVASGIADLHATNTFSGDLGMQNILLGDQGQIHLIDFNPVGLSPVYTAPELLELWDGDEDETITSSLQNMLTAPADIYSLGLVLRALAHEEKTFDYWHHAIPSWYQELVASCLAFSPDDRPSAAQVYRRLLEG